MDNLYTSIPLFEKMSEKGVTGIGTIRKNRLGLPKEIKSDVGRETFSSILWYEKEKGKQKLISYVVNTKSSGKKNVLVLCTHPVLLGVTKDDGKEKPAPLKTYDQTKGGTDICDQRIGSYTTNTKSPRWTKKVLSYMLDVSRVNSQSIHSLNHQLQPRKVDSFDYGWELAMELVMPEMRARRNKAGLQKNITEKIDMFLRVRLREVGAADEDDRGVAAADAIANNNNIIPPAIQAASAGAVAVPHPKTGEKRRCRQSVKSGAGQKERKDTLYAVRAQCQGCQNAACQSHLIQLCGSCHLQRAVTVAPGAVEDELAG